MKTLKSESSILGPLCNQGKVWPTRGFLEPSLYSSYHVHVTLLVNPPTTFSCLTHAEPVHRDNLLHTVQHDVLKWIIGSIIGGEAAFVTCNLSCICYVGGSGWEWSVEGLRFRALWDPGVCRHGHPEGQRHVAEREESVSHWERWNFSVLTHSTVEQTGGCWLL